MKPASPAPRSGSEALTHHRAVLVEERTKSLARNQDWSLRAKMTRYKNTGSLEKHLTGKKYMQNKTGGFRRADSTGGMSHRGRVCVCVYVTWQTEQCSPKQNIPKKWEEEGEGEYFL